MPPDDQTHVEGTIHPNKSALQFYVPSDVVTDRSFPFDDSDDYRGVTIPGTEAVVLWPRGRPPALPLELDALDGDRVPWPVDEVDAALDTPSPPPTDD